MTEPSEDELRRAAIEHAKIPPDLPELRRAHSPLYRLIPDDERPSQEIVDMVEQITGKVVPWWGGAPYIMAARCYSTLTRWAIQQVGVLEARDHIRARELWRDLNRSSDE